MFIILYFLIVFGLFIGLTAERLFIVRRPLVVLLEEGNGERRPIARVVPPRRAHTLVAGLNHSAICAVVPRRVLFKKDAQLPELEPLLRLNEGESDQF